VTCGRSVVFSGYSVSSTNKIDLHDITEILMNVALNTIKQVTDKLYHIMFLFYTHTHIHSHIYETLKLKKGTWLYDKKINYLNLRSKVKVTMPFFFYMSYSVMSK
jgi:hypothetical protein